jgi:CheY-like chemotaxis protein
LSTAGKSILMVDDDQEIRELLQTYLSRSGFQVHAEADGKGFRHALENTPCDLVILDVMLPDEDGFSLCRWVRQHPRQARVPIIMLTASSDEADRVIGLELGADDYLGKPSALANCKQGSRPCCAAPNSVSRRRAVRCWLSTTGAWTRSATVCSTTTAKR